MELTSVSADEAVFFDGPSPRRYEGLEPGSVYELEGQAVRTLPRPPGERLATVATVNDLHFGETRCGVMGGVDLGPVLGVEPGETPYPETMNRAAVADIAGRDPDAVVVKGDLTAHGRDDELGAFLDCYQPAFDGRLHWVRGNHDAVPGSVVPATGPRHVTLPGVCLALLDTAVVGRAGGAVDDDQLEWLDQLAAESDRPVLVFGHHHVWGPGEGGRDEGYFGIEPSSSERLAEVVARRPAILGYFAGHTHRNRVRRLPVTGEVPWVEVACTKDFPGGWAEYQVYEGGILQVFHRISASPEALAWTERTRALFGGLYPAYAFGDLGDRCFAIWPRAGAMRR